MNKLRIHCLLHEDFEGIGCIADWISLHGHDVSFTEFYQDAALPPVNKVDFLIIMGGSMSVNDEATLPWLADEKVFVKALIDANKPVLGICLGAQLIANVLGASVYPNSSKEIGWLPVVLSDFAKSGPLFKGFPVSFNVFQWHGETFDLPSGSSLLASSEACVNQGFMVNDRVLGLQFHFEVKEENVNMMLTSGSDELIEDAWVQSADTITAGAKNIQHSNELMFLLLDYLAAVS